MPDSSGCFSLIFSENHLTINRYKMQMGHAPRSSSFAIQIVEGHVTYPVENAAHFIFVAEAVFSIVYLPRYPDGEERK